jgi:methyl-accepting chemotaxis protein
MQWPPLSSLLHWHPRLGSWTLARRLHAGFAMVLAFLVMIGALSWFQTGRLAGRMDTVVGVQYQHAEAVGAMQNAVSDIMLAVFAMVLTDDPEDMKYSIGEIRKGRQRYEEAATSLSGALNGRPESAALLAQARAVAALQESTLSMVDQLTSSATSGTARETLADFVQMQLSRPRDQWMASLKQLRDMVNTSMHAAAEDTRLTVSRVQAVTASAVALALLAGFFTALTISRSITRPLADAIVLTRRVAQGDLSTEQGTLRTDEYGALQAALGDMQSGLRTMVGEIRTCALNIRTASNEVASGNADLSQRTERAASSLQQTAASMGELHGSVKGSADAAACADQLAESACHAARNGGEVMTKVIARMDDISAASRRIGDIIGVIDGIAFQTNILALNAAVEAARAGEQGRGFAVVAGEVRGLAQRAAAAAREIKQLVGASVEQVDAGTRLVQDAGGAMQAIAGSVQQVSEVIRGIAGAAGQQTAGIGAVNITVGQLDQMTQQNSALVEQSAAAAESLTHQAEKLNALIESFRLEAAPAKVA